MSDFLLGRKDVFFLQVYLLKADHFVNIEEIVKILQTDKDNRYMSQFKSKLLIRLMLDGCWVLEDDLVYSNSYYGDVIVKKGFRTNLASTPKFIRSIIDIRDRYIREPAIIHDAIYKNEYSAANSYNRKKADKIFYYSMCSNGTSWLKAEVIYWIVRVFGRSNWKVR